MLWDLLYGSARAIGAEVSWMSGQLQELELTMLLMAGMTGVCKATNIVREELDASCSQEL
jgi:hypothetical protein